MQVYDNTNNLIAIIVKAGEIKESKTFLTIPTEEFQFGSFNLKSGEVIQKHIHNKQERKIYNTSEALVVISGKLEIDFYDDNMQFLEKQLLDPGDSILIISGGHGIKILEDCKFVEFKQGPYLEHKDKLRFE